METRVNLWLALFGGSGIGLLFGVIMGSSVTPTVATMLGVLTSLLGGILGLNDALFNDAKAVRIGSFGFACVLGAYLGIYVRSHNALSPSIADLKRQYVEAGYSEQQALDFIALREFGFTVSGMQVPTVTAPVAPENIEQAGDNEDVPDAEGSSDADSSNEETNSDAEQIAAVAETPAPAPMPTVVAPMVQQQHSSLLFSAPVEVSGCEELMFTDDSLDAEEVLNNFELTGGSWEALMLDVYDNVAEDQHKPVLLSVRDLVCGVKTLDTARCDDAKSLLSGSDAAIHLAAIDSDWQQIIDHFNAIVSQRALPEQSQADTLNYTHQLLCESHSS